MLNRRELIKNISIITGVYVVGASNFLSGCQNINTENKVSISEVELLNEIAETIIPTTQTAGAKAAQVGHFIRNMVNNCYEKNEAEAFVNGLNNFNQDCKKTIHKPFLKALAQEKKDCLLQLQKNALVFDAAKTKEQPPHYFTMLKQLTLLGYFGSQIGATQQLNYVQIPSKFDGCYPYKEGDKAYAI